MPVIFKNIFRFFKRYLSNLYRNWQERNITRILQHNETPTYYDVNKIFDQLQKSFDPLPEYGYDAYSTWRRGVSRAQSLLERCEALRCPNLKVLDVACGDGMVGYALSCFGHDVTLTDLEDWRDPRSKDLPIVIGDLCSGVSLGSSSFDLVVSYNSFEHIHDPQSAFTEILRVTKPGGIIYLEFGPLYCSPWGLHAFRTLFMPYPQFIFSKSFLEKKFQLLGIRDLGKQREVLQPLNTWRLKQFESLWDNENVSILNHALTTDYAHLDVLRRFPRSFNGLKLEMEDLTTSAIAVALLKNP
jgi:SAM-dependent methyltransferase